MCSTKVSIELPQCVQPYRVWSVWVPLTPEKYQISGASFLHYGHGAVVRAVRQVLGLTADGIAAPILSGDLDLDHAQF
jgi:hypothetical protein